LFVNRLTKEHPMSAVTATPPTHTTTIQARRAAARADRDPKPAYPRMWVLLEALAYSSALLDPTGVLAAQRFPHLPEKP
jgi:hypothetical protein